MSNQTQSKITSLRTSFTKDEIIAKLLGWLRGPNFPRYIYMNSRNFREVELIELPALEVSLEEHLAQLVNISHEEYSKCGDDVPYEIAIVKEEEIERVDKLTRKAYRYAADFEHELLQCEGSMLQIDNNVTNSYGDIYYTIKSADNWAKANYGISIIDYVDPKEIPEEHGRVVPRDDDSDGLSKTVANNLYITFALLIDAFLEADPDYEKKIQKIIDRGLHWQSEAEEETATKARLTVSKLGQYLSLRSRVSGSRKIARGQSDEAIMTHIESAIAYKEKVWATRKTPRAQTK